MTPTIPTGWTPEDVAYARELPRLLAEGHKGRYVLVKGDATYSVWDSQRDAQQAGHERFGAEPFLVLPVEPLDAPRGIRSTPKDLARRPMTEQDLDALMGSGHDLWDSDEDFEEFQRWLRDKRQRGV